jgi:hypothetical protein
MAAMMGWGRSRMTGTTWEKWVMATIPTRERAISSMPGISPGSSRSRPEQKPRPVPVRTTTQQELSLATCRKAS